jgi:ribosomal-protein-alanine N-acetyltransferase
VELVNPEAPIFTGELQLEPIVVDHAARLFEDLSATELYAFIPEEAPASIVGLEKRYLLWAARKRADGDELWLNYAIYHLGLKKYVGTLQATLHDAGKSYIAYAIFPQFWHRGFARSACAGMIDHLFSAYHIPALYALVDTRNESSWKLLESLNFRRISLIEQADYFKGSVSDEYEYETRSSVYRLVGARQAAETALLSHY